LRIPFTGPTEATRQASKLNSIDLFQLVFLVGEQKMIGRRTELAFFGAVC
jgi:hypothetical protein